MGGGIIVPLHRASIVVVPEIAIRIASSDQHRQLVEESDASRAVISFDWVTECVEQDKLLNLNEYKLRSPPFASFNEHQQSSSGVYANSIASSITSEKTFARTEEIVYPNNSQENNDGGSNTTTPKNKNISLTGAKVLNGPPTPPMTPTIASNTNNVQGIPCTELTPNQTGDATEAMEVPEHLMTSFFWLQDKLEVWVKSDFGGSLVGFFTRVKMQVNRYMLTNMTELTTQDGSRSWHELFHTYKGLYFKAIPGLKEKMAKQA
jgi:hypothetical protein